MIFDSFSGWRTRIVNIHGYFLIHRTCRFTTIEWTPVPLAPSRPQIWSPEIYLLHIVPTVSDFLGIQSQIWIHTHNLWQNLWKFRQNDVKIP